MPEEKEVLQDTGGGPVERIELAHTYAGASSYQIVGLDLTLDPGAGRDHPDTAFLAPLMGNLMQVDDPLTKTGVYLAGVIGLYSLTGSGDSHYPTGGVLAGIADGSTDADGAVVAWLDGDSSVTKAGAAFKARARNSNSGSGFDYGLDLYDPAADGYDPLAILKADLRLSNEVCVLSGEGAPTDGTGGTGAGFAGKASKYIDRTAANEYINAGTKASPTWKLITRAA